MSRRGNLSLASGSSKKTKPTILKSNDSESESLVHKECLSSKDESPFVSSENKDVLDPANKRGTDSEPSVYGGIWDFQGNITQTTVTILVQDFVVCTKVKVKSKKKAVLKLPQELPSYVEVTGSPGGERLQSGVSIDSFTVHLYSYSELGSKDASKVHHSPDEDPEPQDRWFRLVIPRYLDEILYQLVGTRFLEPNGNEDSEESQPPVTIKFSPLPTEGRFWSEVKCLSHEVKNIESSTQREVRHITNTVKLGTRSNRQSKFDFLYKTEFSASSGHNWIIQSSKLKNPAGPNSKEHYFAVSVFMRPFQLSCYDEIRPVVEKFCFQPPSTSENAASDPKQASAPEFLLECAAKKTKAEFNHWKAKMTSALTDLRKVLQPKLATDFPAVVDRSTALTGGPESTVCECVDELLELFEDADSSITYDNRSNAEQQAKISEVCTRLADHWSKLPCSSAMRDIIQGLFAKVERDWDELSVLVARNDQMVHPDRKAESERLLELLHTELDKGRVPHQRITYGCARANPSFLLPEPNTKAADISEWLQRQNIHGGTLYAPTFKHQLEYWRSRDLKGVKQNQLKNSIDQLERFKYRFRHLMNALNSKLFYPVKITDPARRKIVVLTDGLISDIQEVLNLLQDYRDSGIIQRDSVVVFGGWDYNLLEINKYLNPEEPATTNSKQPNRKYKKMLYSEAAAVLKASERVEPVPIIAKVVADEMAVALKLRTSNLDIKCTGFQPESSLGGNLSCQVASRTQFLWSMHMIVKVDMKEQSESKAGEFKIKMVATKDIPKKQAETLAPPPSRPKTSLDQDSVNLVCLDEVSPYFCWMVAEKSELFDVEIPNEEQAEIERAHQNLVARVLERDVLTRCNRKTDMQVIQGMASVIGSYTGTTLLSRKPEGVLGCMRELRCIWVLERLQAGLTVKNLKQNQDSMPNLERKITDEISSFAYLRDLFCKKLPTVRMNPKLEPETQSFQEERKIYATWLFLQQTFFFLLHSIKTPFNQLMDPTAPVTKEAADAQRMIGALFQWMPLCLELPSVCHAQLLEVSQKIVDAPATEDITAHIETIDEIAPDAYFHRKAVYYDRFTAKHVGVGVQAYPKEDEASSQEETTVHNDEYQRRLPSVWYPRNVTPPSNFYLSRFFYWFRYLFSQLLLHGFETTVRALASDKWMVSPDPQNLSRLSQTVSTRANTTELDPLVFTKAVVHYLLEVSEVSVVWKDLETKLEGLETAARPNDLSAVGEFLDLLASVVTQINRDTILDAQLCDQVYNEEEITQFGKSLYEALWDEAYEHHIIIASKHVLLVYLSWLAVMDPTKDLSKNLPTQSTDVFCRTLDYYIEYFKPDYSEPVRSVYLQQQSETRRESFDQFTENFFRDQQRTDLVAMLPDSWLKIFNEVFADYLRPGGNHKAIELPSTGLRGRNTPTAIYQNQDMQHPLWKPLFTAFKDCVLSHKFSGEDLPEASLAAHIIKACETDLLPPGRNSSLEDKLWHLLYGAGYATQCSPFLKSCEQVLEHPASCDKKRLFAVAAVVYFPSLIRHLTGVSSPT